MTRSLSSPVASVRLTGLARVHWVQISELIGAAPGQAVREPEGSQRGRTQQGRQRPWGK